MKWLKAQGMKVLVAAVALSALAGCQSPPPLKQVDSDAQEKPINAPEVAAQLKHKYEKSGA
jgi:outer membrane murein-binding lipoprotein Lpp